MKAGHILAAVVALAVASVGLVLFVGSGLSQSQPAAACQPGQPVTVAGGALPGEVAGWSGEQLANAAATVRAGADLGIDARGQAIAVMTAMGESSLVNVAHGDAVRADTVGLFQTGPEHGSYDARMDPYQAAVLFFERLTAVPNWQELPPTIAAHRAQRNADPLHYEQHWPDALAVLAALSRDAGAAVVPVVDNADKRYDLGPVQPHTQALAEEVGTRFDVADVGGQRESAVDAGGHPAGLAVDFMTGDDLALGDAIAAYLIEHAERLSVDYIIWRQAIWHSADPQAGWRPMADRGSPTANHYDHPHVNLRPTPSATSGVGALECLSASAVAPAGLATHGEWVAPVDGPITSRYGPRWGKFHGGTDFGAPCGTPIYAASDGRVIYAGNGPHPRLGLTGHVIVIDHGAGVQTSYNHMYAGGLGVRPGQVVQAGQLIAAVGNDGFSTGCHLHYGVYLDGQHTDAEPFMASVGAPLG